MSALLPAARRIVPSLCVLLLAGCGDSRPPSHVVESSPPPQPQAPAQSSPPERLPDGALLTVADLLRRVRVQAPTTESAAALRAAVLAMVRQSGAWANPELELRAGTSRYRSGDEADQRTWGADLRQRFELPGKRASRIAAARAGEPVAEHEAAQGWLELEAEVRAAAVALSVAQASLARAESAAELAAALRQTVEHRTRAGELAKADLARASLDEATATIAVARRRRDVQGALGAVRSWCGGGLPASFTISDALSEAPPEIALAEVLRQAQERHPRLRLLAAQVGQRSAEMQRERDAWQPDLTLGLSADRGADTDDLGLSLGLDLPLWDRGSGAMAAAEAERTRASAALRAERQALERAVLGAWNAYESARLELAALSTQALPVAEDAVRLRQAAYAAGEDSLADLLESKRAAQDVADAILAARRAAAEAGIALGRAVGSFTTSQESQP